MKRCLLVGILPALVYFGVFTPSMLFAKHGNSAGNPRQAAVSGAFEQQQSNVQVHGSGRVAKILSDDRRGSRHQRFILQLPSGQTLLVAHNIDLAHRVASLQVGDTVEFYGEYEWNPRGGVLHWTHRDPLGRHVHGWLKHKGVTYE